MKSGFFHGESWSFTDRHCVDTLSRVTKSKAKPRLLGPKKKCLSMVLIFYSSRLLRRFPSFCYYRTTRLLTLWPSGLIVALIGRIGKLTTSYDRCDPTTQSALAGLTFESLITSFDGRAVARKLVTALIEQQIGQELGVSNFH